MNVFKHMDRLIFDPFFGDFLTPNIEDDRNFHEAEVNLFLKLQTSTIMDCANLGVKLKKIEAKIRNLCQFDRFFLKNDKYQKALVSNLV